MNSHLNKEIFSETGCINKEILLLYSSGKLRDSEKHDVEKHLVDCNLCTEALEGFALLAGTDSFDEVNRRLENLTNGKGSVSTTRYFAVAASVMAVLTLTYFAYKQFEEIKVERLATSETVKEVDSVQMAPVIESVVEENKVEAPVAEKLHNLQTQVQPQDLAAPIEQQTENEVTQNTTADAEIVNAESINIPEEPALKIAASETDNKDVVTLSNAGTMPSAGYATNVTYVDNRKVIDYAAVAKTKETTSQKAEKSVPSKYENRQKKVASESDEALTGNESKRKVDYLHLLAEPIALYNDGNYVAAIKGFDELLVINPGDENARFYKGMSLYHLKKYDSAIDLLKPLSTINTQPFSEEALFYVAKSYSGKSEKQQAISIFRTIVANRGFYAEKARLELKKLE